MDGPQQNGAFADGTPRPRPVLIEDLAPEFRARTTMGEHALTDYRGRWLLFFAHPADFTPVCTSEFVALARAYDRFQALGCDLLALSVDSLFSHLAWARSIEERFGVAIPFPMVEDPSMAIARAYGMIHPGASSSATVRALFLIDPDGIVRSITWYPMTVGRSVDEILRLLAALQASDAGAVSTPEGWHPGDPVIAAVPLTMQQAAAAGSGEGDWYYQMKGA